MKLRTFYASDGDCLLLTSSDNHRALIDGGRAETFESCTWPTLRRLALAKEAVDLVVVSHVDADHISGILRLAKAVAEWVVYDYQTNEGGNRSYPKPDGVRPPAIKKIWHNSWRAQVGDLAGEIESFVAVAQGALQASALDVGASSPVVSAMAEAVAGVAASIPQGVELRRIIDEQTAIPRNNPFGDLVLLRKPPYVERLGKSMKLTVIGPDWKHLERLREEWREWLDSAQRGRRRRSDVYHAPPTDAADVVTTLSAASKVIEETDPRKVTPPNRASITLLAEETNRTCLLTGDAAEEEILEGLEAAGRLRGDAFHCNVVKVQHHGSEHNLSKDFAEKVLAQHYVFCANGSSGNPDPRVVRTIVDRRLACAEGAFTLWFNCSPTRAGLGPRLAAALDAAITEATDAAKEERRVKVKVLSDARSYFDILV